MIVADVAAKAVAAESKAKIWINHAIAGIICAIFLILIRGL